MQKSYAIRLAASLALIALIGTGVAGCSSKKSRAPASTGDTVSSTDSALSSGADGAGAQVDPGAEGISGPTGGLLSQRIVYFDFDRSDIRGDFVDMIAAHGRYVASHPSARLRLEGHSDERGSREYNIGLGERRAQAVRRALALQGVSEAQVATVSYGEERPADSGSSEDSWAKNRRVEIVYLSQ